MYALTTCQHCKNTRKFFEEQKLDVIIIYLDDYSGNKRAELMEKVRTYNPRGTFPVVIVPGGKVVVGFRKQLLKEALIDDAGRTA
ncbi:MAG: glutaredoxin family protein [Mailhella sp.]|nr:glutaredoxin family protein [Mailhella sp.]